MKRYLLFLLMCVCASVGAWAELGVSYDSSTTTLTVTFNTNDDLTDDAANISWSVDNISGSSEWKNTATRVVFQMGNNVTAVHNNILYPFSQQMTNVKTFDFSNLTTEQVAYFTAGNDNFKNAVTNVVKNVIVPSGVTISQVDNNFTVSGTTVIATKFSAPTNVDWAMLARYGNTLKLTGNISSTLDLGSVTGFTTIDLTEANVTANISLNEDVVTLVNVASSGTASYIKKKDGSTAFDSNKIDVPFSPSITVAGSSLKTNIEAYLAGYSGKTKDDITTLNVTGTLSSADITYLSTMSGLTTLNLSAATGDVTNLASNTVTTLTLPSTATALPNNIATNLPSLASSIYVYSYDSQNGLTSLDAFVASAGGLSSMVADLKSNIGTTNSLAWSCNNGTIKVSGSLNSSDVTVLNDEFLNCHTLDLSGATGITISDLTTTGGHNVVKLPAGSEIPSTLANNIWNKGGGSADMIIYSLSSDGQTISIWSNNVGTIANAITGDNAIAGYTGVQYALIKGRTDKDFSTDITALANKKIGLAKDPVVTNGCEVTINRAFSTATMAALLADAKTALGGTDICTIVVTGQLSDTDLAALGGTDATGATRIDMSGATLASGASVTSLTIPASLQQLVLPPGQTVKGTALQNTLSNNLNLVYAYSPTTDDGATIADYVWANQGGGLNAALKAEGALHSSIYIKVESIEQLTATDMDLTYNGVASSTNNSGLDNLKFFDVSGAALVPAVSATYKAPHSNPYRIILPDNRTGDQMAIYANNSQAGALAAVYSYTGTKLNILEINDDAYSPAALADGRIMRSTTTEVDVVSGTISGVSKSNFGERLLAAINNMGKSTFSVTETVNNEQVTTNYTNTVGLNVKKVVVATGSNVFNTLTFDNPTIEVLELRNISNGSAVLNVDACSSLKELDLTYSSLASVDASVSAAGTKTGLATVDMTGTTVTGNTDLSGSPVSTFTTDGDTWFKGDLNLTSSALTSFSTAAKIGTTTDNTGNIYLNASSSLATLDVTQTKFQNTSSVIHIDASATENAENTDAIDALDKTEGGEAVKTIKVPTGFALPLSTRIHPYSEVADNIEETVYVPDPVTIAYTDMKLHEKEAATDGDHFIYWYQDTSNPGKNVTIGTGATQSLSSVLTNKSSELDFANTTYRRGKITGPVTSSDISSLASINCQVLDLSDATFDATAWTALKTAFAASGTGVHSSVRFVILPDGSTRDDILNGTALAGLTNVLSVISTKKITGAADASDNGTNLTTWSRVSGAVQAAVVAAGNHSCASWTKTPDGETERNIYTSDVSDFRVCQISGLINSHDLSKANQQLDANGHLSWDKAPVEISSGTDPRVINGGHTAYGPFSSSFMLSVIDLRDAYFEAAPAPAGTTPNPGDERYYFSDMTLSALGIVTSGTYKVVIPTDNRVKEIPADFMAGVTHIRAICIPSNIRAIRTRAFYSLDYVWTTGTTIEGTADPEGANTKLDNGARLKVANSDSYVPTSALIYENGAYKENPAFTKACYLADYGTIDGGGTYTFGSNLRLIETRAFANTEPHVKDVYVLNTTAPECHVDAFNTMMYNGNNGYSPIQAGDKIISRNNYFNGKWITMLHYPRQTTTPQLQRYTDPTRQYSIATGERDGKGAMLYFPNHSEFYRAYQQGTYGYIWNAWNPARSYGAVTTGDLPLAGWSAESQSKANAEFDKYSSGANHQYMTFYKVSDFANETITAPTDPVVPYNQVNWDESSYSTVETGGNLYPRSEVDAGSDVDGSGEKTSKDYRGWHQFVLNAYAANTVLEEKPYRLYVSDNDWWTFCPTIDMTKKQVIELFGSENTSDLPYVSRLLYVRREYADNTIWLNFSNNLMVYKEDREYSKPTTTGEGDGAVTTPASQHGRTDTTTGIVKVSATKNSVDDDDVVMSAGVPYLIKPFRVADETGKFITQFRIFKTQVEADKLKDATVRKIVDEDLYNKLNNAETLDGAAQIAKVESGLYTVPVFVKGDAQSGTAKESDDGMSYSIGEGEGYKKSTTWDYTFVGSYYLSPLPQYCYYLGKTSAAGPVTFIYNNYTNYSTAVFRWVNQTAVICPTKKTSPTFKPTFKVTPASGLNPALWNLNTKGNTNNVTTNTYLEDDSFATTSSSRGNLYNMHFGAEPVVAHGETVVINETATVHASADGKVYSVDGRLKGNSLKGLAKGVYVVNGKKYVVK